MELYEIRQGREVIGNVQLSKAGLYLDIVCSCDIGTDVMYDLVMYKNGMCKTVSLLIPEGEYHGLHKRISLAEAGEAPYLFGIQPRHQNMEGRLSPLYDGSPRQYLYRMEASYMSRRSQEN